MDGKTAYEVSKEGYSKHLSQQWTWFTDWINGKNNSYTKATDIKTYSPLKYGLYYSTVGEDIAKNDMFENIIYYKTQLEEEKRLEELAEEEKKKQEQSVKKELSNTDQDTNNKIPLKSILAGILAIILLIITIKIIRSKKRND